MSGIRFVALALAGVATIAVGAAAAQNYSLNPTYGVVNLASGFQPDPWRRNLDSGGSINAAGRSGGACQGFIADAPDFRVNFTAGRTPLPLVFSVNSRADTTLVINGPDGRWYCDDDSGNGELNPSYTFRRPASGQYDVWVGTYGSSSLAPATLSISELYSD